MKKTLQIDVEDERAASERFIRNWKQAETGEEIETEHRLCFESLELLLKTLTAARIEVPWDSVVARLHLAA